MPRAPRALSFLPVVWLTACGGVYFWHLTTADGRQKLGRFTVIDGER